MHILAFIILFIVGSIGAACEGDWSGMEVIGKIILFIALFFIIALMALNPVLLIIPAVVFVIIIIIACYNK